MDDCIFCKIIRGELPSKKVYEDKEVLAFYDINPLAPIHILVIPKKHIINLVQSSDEDLIILGKIQRVAANVAKELKIEEAFRLLTANGQRAGQSVFHLHYHLIGGWKNKSPEMESQPGDLKKHD